MGGALQQVHVAAAAGRGGAGRGGAGRGGAAGERRGVMRATCRGAAEHRALECLHGEDTRLSRGLTHSLVRTLKHKASGMMSLAPPPPTTQTTSPSSVADA